MAKYYQWAAYIFVCGVLDCTTPLESPVERGNVNRLSGCGQQGHPGFVGGEVGGGPRGIGQVLRYALNNAKAVTTESSLMTVDLWG